MRIKNRKICIKTVNKKRIDISRSFVYDIYLKEIFVSSFFKFKISSKKYLLNMSSISISTSITSYETAEALYESSSDDSSEVTVVNLATIDSVSIQWCLKNITSTLLWNVEYKWYYRRSFRYATLQNMLARCSVWGAYKFAMQMPRNNGKEI